MYELKPILFYLSLIFGYGLGLFAFFSIGRLGGHQILYWLSGMPQQKNPSGGEAQTMCSLIGIPTSGDDLIAISTNLTPVKTAYDLAKYIYGNFGAPFAYLGSILGRNFGRLWFFFGIPIFVLDVIIAPDYLPQWVTSSGFGKWSFAGVLSIGYFASYSVGFLFEAPQRKFNRARLIYEGEVAKHGYWFDCYLSSSFSHDKKSLKKSYDIFQKIEKILKITPIQNPLLIQRKMVLSYQLALLLSGMKEFDAALNFLREAVEYREKTKKSNILEAGEYETTKSQMSFLEGELLYVNGDLKQARIKFLDALEIDERMQDEAGVTVIKKRLKLTEHQ